MKSSTSIAENVCVFSVPREHASVVTTRDIVTSSGASITLMKS